MTLAEQATDRLKHALLSGEISGGKAMTERNVCEYLGMSRTPVRAALQALAAEGVLTYQAQRGYQMREFDKQAVLDAYQVRAVLEGQACREIAMCGLSESTQETLLACVVKGKKLLAEDRKSFVHEHWREMNSCFHHALLDALSNETLKEMLLHIEKRPMLSFQVIAKLGVKPDFSLLSVAQTDHERVLKYLQAGDAERASNAMVEHVRVAGDLLLEGW
ncbi:GntR family transcriptional regulator [Granulosicoccus antarcticus]|uniref:Putative D-xylose utilization operon transcriptional repressor n=1 Tax=Granulosicoccus antarcticus IMCC3135 TaxID=1192854 RepID=A0A2Z2NYT0_9GAMM|nr:GntR family transcriptional regulator [Granulosicoccus antarcticus]ASJ72927.1 putative D-xylose utilization operon transcriptional repressor [Granulosicoccus antarcticus IMCC3135]